MEGKSTNKKANFLNEVVENGCAVLVGPLLQEDEVNLIENGPLLLVDGACELASKYGLDQNRTVFKVGDGDSSDEEMDALLPENKDYSDLSFALTLVPKEIKKIKLFGFLGGRKDHELINFGEVYRFLSTRPSYSTVEFSPELRAISSGSWTLNHKGIFSLLPLGPTEISLQGSVSYPLATPTNISPLSSRTLSNEAQGEFKVMTDKPLFIYGEGLKVNLE